LFLWDTAARGGAFARREEPAIAANPVPAPCQDIAAELAQLQQQYADQSAAAAKLAGAPAWAAAAALGTLRSKIQDTQSQLDSCVKTQTSALTGTVVVMDASGEGAPAAQNATLWDLATTTSLEVAPIQAGAFGFADPLPAQPAITLQTTGDPTVNGLDFRSGPLPQPEAPDTRIEIVLAPETTISPEQLASVLAAFEWNTTIEAGSGGNVFGAPLTLNFGSLTAAFSQGLITLHGSGTLGGGLIPATTFVATMTVSLVASVAAKADTIIEVALSGQQPVTASLSAGGINLSALVGVVGFGIGPPVQAAISNWANENVSAAVLQGFAVAALPAHVGITLRKFTVDQSGIAFQPALGTIGTALSTWKPNPLPAEGN
jgi:hypothetical protein